MCTLGKNVLKETLASLATAPEKVEAHCRLEIQFRYTSWPGATACAQLVSGLVHTCSGVRVSYAYSTGTGCPVSHIYVVSQMGCHLQKEHLPYCQMRSAQVRTVSSRAVLLASQARLLNARAVLSLNSTLCFLDVDKWCRVCCRTK